MKRLVVVLVVLAIVLIAVAAEMKRNPEGDPQARLERLTPAERVQLEKAKHEFSQTRGRFLQLRDKGAPAAEVQAQEKKVAEAAQKVVAIGGEQALRDLGDQGRAGRYGRMARGMRGRGGRGGGRRGATPTGRRPGGPAGDSAPAGDDAGTSRAR